MAKDPYYDEQYDQQYYQEPYYQEDDQYGDSDYYLVPAEPRRRGPNLLVSAGIAAALLACTLAVCGVVGAIAYLASGSGSSAAATAPAAPTVVQVSAPQPIVQPLSVAPPWPEIRDKAATMPEAQWELYSRQLKGARVENWTGWVVDASQIESGQYTVRVDMDSGGDPSAQADVMLSVGADVAQALQPGQQVTFSGRIESAYKIMGFPVLVLVDVLLQPGPVADASQTQSEVDAAPAAEETSEEENPEDPYTLQVLNVEDPTAPNEGYQVPEGSRMVGVELILKNVSGDVIRVDPVNAVVIDTEGETYNAEWGGRAGQIEEVDLGPGQEVAGWIGFILPEGATPAKIRYTIATDPSIILKAKLPS